MGGLTRISANTRNLVSPTWPLTGCRQLSLPLLFEAHSSVLDLVFYEGEQFPPEYKGHAFVALKGSWKLYRADRLQGRARAIQGGQA